MAKRKELVGARWCWRWQLSTTRPCGGCGARVHMTPMLSLTCCNVFKAVASFRKYR